MEPQWFTEWRFSEKFPRNEPVQHAGDTILSESLLQTVWGFSQDPKRSLEDHIFRLRWKLGTYGWQYIENFFGIGYRFRPIRAAKRQGAGLRVYVG